MDYVKLNPDENAICSFIPREFLPEGKTQYSVREEQAGSRFKNTRELTADEIKQLIQNGNTADSWENIRVTDPFVPGRVRGNEFQGLVRIGSVHKAVLEHHDLKLPVGIYNSRIADCDIGDDTAVHNVRYLAHCIIGSRCILLNIDEMHTTSHAKFGNGIIREGEPEKVRIWMDIMNEAGTRAVLPFDGMIPADAYMWAKYRDDALLQKKLVELTEKRFDKRRGYYSVVGDHSVIKHTRILKDVKIGSCCYIKGANKLKNLTIHSRFEERSQIGEGVELVNGIIGYGCHIFYGCKAVRFILGNNSKLTYGARLIHSFLGPNSTISCCEVLNNLIFPAHEQHHNNSFLVASVCMGQTNLAAGATIGSNHNSRANDNEVQAGRGFWPGLCTSIKHSSRFASFTLLAKGAYPAEMDIQLPFSLVNNNKHMGRLEVMPAFWWMYNMYALARNAWKLSKRDKRKTKTQNVEFDMLAPDSVEEIFTGMALIEQWTGAAALRAGNGDVKAISKEGLRRRGAALLEGPEQDMKGLTVLGEHMEKSQRPAVILRPRRAYGAYRQMLLYYGVCMCMAYVEESKGASVSSMHKALAGPRQTGWVNLGGQLCREQDVDRLRDDIGKGVLDTWEAVHARYDALWEEYTLHKQQHAYAVLCSVMGTDSIDNNTWNRALEEGVSIQEYIRDQVRASRGKDFDNRFRKATYRNQAEMDAAIGTIDDNSFVQQVDEDTKEFKKRAEQLMQNNT